MSINPNIKSKYSNSNKSVDYYFQGIISGDRYILSEAISLVESSVSRYTSVAMKLLELCYQHNNLPSTHRSWRIGITGSPGTGKSSFIETWGSMLVKQYNKRVAVLAIDPSSTITNGSILGDKTRMPNLSIMEEAFIRPSPSRNCLGGVSSATKETICLCEAAGYDIILVETVGVGQSETMISQLVDMFVLLLLPGAGDEIQGIKRGIVEMADLVLVNKSDGDRVDLSKLIQQNYKNALHLFQAKQHKQLVEVLLCSSIEATGMSEVWMTVSDFFNSIIVKSYIDTHRLEQDLSWFETRALLSIEHSIMYQEKYKSELERIRRSVKKGEVSPYQAGAKFDELLYGN